MPKVNLDERRAYQHSYYNRNKGRLREMARRERNPGRVYLKCVSNSGPMTWDRIMHRVEPEPNSGCWLWIGRTNAQGYGTIGVKLSNGSCRRKLVHRVMYSTTHGSIPPGMFVLHKCDVRSCCNPQHLFLGTQRDNVLDAKAKGRLKPPPRRTRVGVGGG